jgi:FkbM family methyltransferase
MMKLVNGMGWLIRGGGLRGQLAQLESRLEEMKEQLLHSDHRVHALMRHAERNCEVLGHQMELDERDSLGLLWNGCFEPFETDFVSASVKKGDVVLDVGANIGYYTLQFARLVGESGRVFAFEPDPTNFSLLRRNVQRNGYRNVELIQKAVTAQSGAIQLYLCEENRGDHRAYDSHDGRPSITIESVSLDDYFKDYDGRIDLIKMDIQGSEGGALRGMAGILSKHSTIKLLTEFWPVGLLRSGLGAAEFLGLLRQFGFEVFNVNEDARKLEPADPVQLMRIFTPEKENFTDLFCKRAA